jgi:hypothetical protein
MEGKDTQSEFAFANGERNRFYRPEATHEFPVYLEPDVCESLNRLALEQGMDIQDLVNKWLRMNIAMVESTRPAA